MATHIVIIGNGISGITCARYIRKQDSDVRITVISGETQHFFARTALMYIYMGHMKYEHTKPYEDDFWPKNRIDLVHEYVIKVDAEGKKLLMADNSSVSYDKLVLACGSKSNFFGWPGQDLTGVQGLYNYGDLQSMEANTKNIKHAVIVGGGLIGIEMAEMLRSRNIAVTFLVREEWFWANVLSKEEGELIQRHIAEHHIDLLLETELDKINDDGSGRVKSITTKDGKEIACQFVGITAGVSPNIDFLKDSTIDTKRGILVNEYLETNIPDVYAIGDCAQFAKEIPGRRPIEQVWYTGRMQAQTLAQTLCGNKTEYQPGPWFNSAKFLDIEYQNYGMLPANVPDGNKQFYWEHSNGKIALRMQFKKTTKRFLALNVFGIRLRHELFDSWLRTGASVEEVLSHLRDANFDPEFYKTYEQDIITTYNKQFGTDVKVKKRSWNNIFNIKRKVQNV